MESPLDVLSRAATMLQETADPEETENKILLTKQTQGGSAKWKRDRKSRLPAYSRKSDPKITECLPNPKEDGGGSPPDSPLDMSVRQRGQPPSYTQTINNPGYRSSFRTSVITSTPPPPPPQQPPPQPPPQPPTANNRELPSGISMCDPIIDEHFRRSLGKDYVTLFSNNNVATTNGGGGGGGEARLPSPEATAVLKTTKQKTSNTTPPPPNNANNASPNGDATSVKELMDRSGLSVDDHFAKALGDTWLKLNKKDSNGDIKNGTPERVVSI